LFGRATAYRSYFRFVATFPQIAHSPRSPGFDGKYRPQRQRCYSVGHGALTIFGHVEGELRASTVIIAEGAQMEGEVSAEELTIGGYVKGTIHANRVKLSGAAEDTAAERGILCPDVESGWLFAVSLWDFPNMSLSYSFTWHGSWCQMAQ
jgi:Polymer-forming cytoskeletal